MHFHRCRLTWGAVRYTVALRDLASLPQPAVDALALDAARTLGCPRRELTIVEEGGPQHRSGLVLASSAAARARRGGAAAAG